MSNFEPNSRDPWICWQHTLTVVIASSFGLCAAMIVWAVLGRSAGYLAYDFEHPYPALIGFLAAFGAPIFAVLGCNGLIWKRFLRRFTRDGARLSFPKRRFILQFGVLVILSPIAVGVLMLVGLFIGAVTNVPVA